MVIADAAPLKMRSAGARGVSVGDLPQHFRYLGRLLRVWDHLPQKHRLDLGAGKRQHMPAAAHEQHTDVAVGKGVGVATVCPLQPPSVDTRDKRHEDQ